MSSKMRQISRMTDRLNSAFNQASNVFARAKGAMESYGSSTNTLRNHMNNLRSSLDSTKNSMNNLRNNAESNVGSLKKLAGGILAVVGAQKLLENTIGAAAKVEMEQVSMEALFKNNQKAANQFFNYLNDQAKSSLFGQNDFLTAGKAFVPLTKNVQQLEYATKLTERLAASNPLEGMEGASFSIREALSGDLVSLQERFNLPRSSLKSLKEATTMTGKLKALDKVLSNMGYTQNYMNKVNDTAYAKWLKLKDTVTLAAQSIGSAALSKAKPAIDGLTTLLSGKEFGQFKTMAGNALAGVFNGVSKAINYVVQNKDKIGPVLTSIGNGFNMIGNVAKTVGSAIINHWGAAKVVLAGFAAGFVALKAAAGIVSVFQTVTGLIKVFSSVITVARTAMALFNAVLFANPIGLVITGITALIAVGVLLYKNWDKIKAKAAEVGAAIKSYWHSATSKISKFFGDMWKSAKEKFWNIVDDAKKLPGRIKEGIENYAHNAVKGIENMANKLVAKFKEVLGIHSPSRVFTTMGKHIVEGLINGLSFANLKQFGMSVLKDFGGGVIKGWNAVKSVLTGLLGGNGGNATSWLAAALGLTGTPLSWLSGLQKLVNAESGGNPNAINKSTVLGQHATGLLQMLPSTFRANMLKGHGNIFNPVDNAAAAIQYIKSRYGSVYNTPLFKGGNYKGYYHGIDRVPYDRMPAVLHKGERILTRKEADEYDKMQAQISSATPAVVERNASRSVTQTINIAKLADYFVIREDADIDKIADQLAMKMKAAWEAGA
jgi:hypothetical protein